MTVSRLAALVTGGSSGIGFELATLFVKNDYDVILVADNETKLQAAAMQLKNLDTGARVNVIASDLSKPDGAEKVFNAVQKHEWQVDILVNNAGAGVYGEFAKDTSLNDELAMIQLNVLSVVQLTKLFVKEMIARGQGKILITASIAGLTGAPNLTVYGATKAFVYSFAEGLRNEVKDFGVTVTALLPGATDTNFFKRAGMEHTKTANGNLADPKDVAQDGFDALMKGDDHVVSPLKPRIMAALLNLVPEEMATKAATVK